MLICFILSQMNRKHMKPIHVKERPGIFASHNFYQVCYLFLHSDTHSNITFISFVCDQLLHHYRFFFKLSKSISFRRRKEKRLCDLQAACELSPFDFIKKNSRLPPVNQCWIPHSLLGRFVSNFLFWSEHEEKTF